MRDLGASSRMRSIGIGILGFGTVGAGVVEGLQRNARVIGERLGLMPAVLRIADLDLEADRGVAVEPDTITRDAEAVVRDENVRIVVELIGGTGAAKELVMLALELGKPVVTANKALLAEHGREIFELAERRGVDLYFGASVGGGIPVIRALREGLIGNRINSIHGILNGTCNYILTRMEAEGLEFEQVLGEAQAAGYAEADPALDIDGTDTAHKAVILASLAYGFSVPMSSVATEGIRGISRTDIRYAGDLGYRIKLLAVIKREDSRIEVRVHPTLVPLNTMLASVGGVYNAVMVEGDLVGKTLYYGRGAGRKPTASTVISDIAEVMKNLEGGSRRPLAALAQIGQPAGIMDIGEVVTRYYLRLSLLDRPGVLGRIADILGANGISIASVIQKDISQDDYVPVVIVTHRACEAELNTALGEIDALEIVGAPTVRFRIEE